MPSVAGQHASLHAPCGSSARGPRRHGWCAAQLPGAVDRGMRVGRAQLCSSRQQQRLLATQAMPQSAAGSSGHRGGPPCPGSSSRSTRRALPHLLCKDPERNLCGLSDALEPACAATRRNTCKRGRVCVLASSHARAHPSNCMFLHAFVCVIRHLRKCTCALSKEKSDE